VLIDGRGGFVAAQVGDGTWCPRPAGVAIHAWLTWAAANRPGGAQLRDQSIERV
jgi:hypothetical protein